MIKSRKPAAGEFTLFRRRRTSAGRRVVALLSFVLAVGLVGLAVVLALPGAPLSSAAANLLGGDSPTTAPVDALPGPQSALAPDRTDKPGAGGKMDKPGAGGKTDKPGHGDKTDKPGRPDGRPDKSDPDGRPDKPGPDGRPDKPDAGSHQDKPDTGPRTDKPLPPVQVPSVSVPAPTSITIDRLGVVDQSPVGLQVTDDELQVPEDYADIGWWSDGPTPGSTGAAIVVGHLDSPTGPAVFYELGALAEGDEIVVRRADRSTATFEVEDVRSYSRDDFPSERVYREEGPAALHLLTCGGEYDTVTGEYTENVVVYAALVDLDEPDRRQASEREQREGRRS